MIEVGEAVSRVLEVASAPVAERVPLHGAHGRVLVRDAVGDAPIPAWATSAMDGFAVRAADLAPGAATLAVVEEIYAGRWPARAVGAGEAAYVTTGAPLPAGADAVVPVEDASPRWAPGEARVHLSGAVAPGAYVREAGSDVAVGDLVVAAGRTLDATALGALASLGRAWVDVARRPRVVIVTTGDEVVRGDAPLRPGQIRSSNDVLLAALVAEAGAVPVDGGHAPDDADGLRACLARAVAAGDVVLTTGGVSAGAADLVRAAWASLGAREVLYKVRMKPGMPLLVVRPEGPPGGAQVAFGLPGNPVSAAATFLVAARPLLRRMLGDPAPGLPRLRVVAGEDMPSRPGRARFERVALRAGPGGPFAARPRDQASHVLSGLVGADALLVLAPDSPGLRAGEAGDALLLRPWPGGGPAGA